VLHDLEPVFERPGGLLEAPRLSADVAVVFSDVNGGGVYRDGEPVVPKRRGVGGIVPHRDGGLVITGRTLLHGDRELHAADDLAGYNDLTTTPEGHVLVGALRFRPLAGEEPVPSPLLRVTGPGQATVLSEAVLWPNGVGLAPSGDRLYLNDYPRRRVVTIGAGRQRRGSVLRRPAWLGRRPGGRRGRRRVDRAGGRRRRGPLHARRRARRVQTCSSPPSGRSSGAAARSPAFR
jgi:sugar lactone lactonase YvrE